MQELYPLKFQPIYKEKLWGGDKIGRKFHRKDIPAGKIGESWDLSAIEGNESVVKNGFLEGNTLTELVEIYMADLVGEKVFEQFGTEFPLLIKLIEAKDLLSLQVHPDDETAFDRHHSYGKTEMWYVIENEPEAKLISGFKRKTTSDEFQKSLANNTFQELLNYEEAVTGDVFYIPAGQIHALGSNLLIAEIQQSSDITYRVSDWGRTDDNGIPRELHLEQALDVIDYSGENNGRVAYQKEMNKSLPVVESPFFTTNVLEFDRNLIVDYNTLDSFVVYMCIKGSATIVQHGGGRTTIKGGETVLIPADLRSFTIKPERASLFLEIFIP